MNSNNAKRKKPAGKLTIISIACLVIGMVVMYFPYENRPSGYLESLGMGMIVGVALIAFIVLGIIAIVFYASNKKAERKNNNQHDLR